MKAPPAPGGRIAGIIARDVRRAIFRIADSEKGSARLACAVLIPSLGWETPDADIW